jgi:CoA:oxalate CoA-transferase
MKIDVAMLDCQIAILENAIARYAATGVAPGPLGARHPSITPFAAYQAGDGWIIIAAGNNGLFEKLCGVLERPDVLADPEFATNDLRTTNADRLAHEMEFTLRHGTVAHWMEKLEEAGVPHAPINNVQQALNDPHVRARNMVVTVDDPVTGPLEIAGNPIKLSAFEDPRVRGPVPDLDGQRAAILAWLGR